MATRLRILTFCSAGWLLVSSSGWTQEKSSPLTRYQGIERPEAAIKTTQIYRSLLDVPKVPTAAPLNDSSAVLSAASKVKAITDDRFKLLPKGGHPIGNNKWAVQYGLAITSAVADSGLIPLAQPSSKMLLIQADGQPLEFRDRQIPVVLPVTTEPTVTPEVASGLAREEAVRQWSRLYPDRPVLMSWKSTTPVKEIWVDSDQQGHLAWLLLVRAQDVRVPVSLQCWVAATGDPRILHVDDLVYAAHHGNVVGSVWMTSPTAGPTHNTPLAGARLTRLNVGDAITADQNGKFEFPGNMAARDMVMVGLFGPRCVILNDAGPELRQEDTPLASDVAVLKFQATDEADLAQLSAFYWVNQAAEFANSKVKDRLNYVPTRVNLNDTGNAFWDGYALNFFKSGNGFPNTAYSDVIIHEFGHAVDGRLGGIRSRGYSEGFGDALAILITQQPLMGRDFFGMGQPMRDAREVVKWTDADVAEEAGEPHRVGQVYAGFVWQLIEELRTVQDPDPFATARRLVLDSAEMNPEDIVDALRLTFVADDNDGNLANGTPHAAVIARAADSRKIPKPPELP